jgi:hypothetical protein
MPGREATGGPMVRVSSSAILLLLRTFFHYLLPHPRGAQRERLLCCNGLVRSN